MKTANWIGAILLAGASTVSAAWGVPDPSLERAGEVFSRFHGGQYCGNGVLHDGNSTGTTIQYGGESHYIAQPRRGKPDAAIVYLTDIFGNRLVNNRLLADSLARAGYLVVMPDLFRDDPVPLDAMGARVPGFNMTEWSSRHPQSQIEKVIDTAIEAVQNEFNITKIGAVGYCFGGKYVARYLAAGKGIDTGFTAHPSNTLASEWSSIAGPISIAFGDLDQSSTPENRTNIEEIFKNGNKTYQTVLYANAEHGFAVRTNLTNKQKAFAQESAYFQAVRWFDAWLKDSY